MINFGKEGIIERLSQLDSDLMALYPDAGHFDLVIVGGSALVLRDLAPGKTHTVDIDALQTAEELETLLERYDINTHVDTFRFRFPNSFEERLVDAPFQGEMLRVRTLSNEDLAITKMLAWRDQDRDDVAGMLAAGNIDMDNLFAIVDDIAELRINLDEPGWAAFREHLSEVASWAEQGGTALPAKETGCDLE